jgi:hypothetical protein
VVIVEKWVEGKQPFQVIWEGMDQKDIEISNDIPQGPFTFQTDGPRATLTDDAHSPARNTPIAHKHA